MIWLVLFDELLIVWRPEHESMESRHDNENLPGSINKSNYLGTQLIKLSSYGTLNQNIF